MKYLTIALSLMAMLITENTLAQKKCVPIINWTIAAELPALPAEETAVNNPSKSLGFAGPVTGIDHNIFFVAGGSNFPDSMPWNNGTKKYYDDVFIYKIEGQKLIAKKHTYKLPEKIAYPANCSIAGGVFYAGGENEQGISNKAWVLKWNEVSENIVIKKLPDLPIAITNAAATVSKNIVYVAGGETAAAASNQFFSLDLNHLDKGWQQLPDIPIPVSHTVLAAQSNGQYTCIYLLGGRKKNANGISDIYKTAYEYDVKKNTWLQKKSLPYELCAGTGIAAGKNEVYLFGGDRGNTFHKVETTIAAIKSESDDLKKDKLIRQKIELLSTHPGFSKEILMFNTIKNKWIISSVIPEVF